jgi:amidase
MLAARFIAILTLSMLASPVAAELTAEEIVALDALELRDGLAAGTVSAEATTAAYAARIARLDRAGPRLGAVIELNPDALGIARELDRQRKEGGLGPLFGVPVLIKANIDTGDRMATSAGSLALAEHRAARDAAVVARLRAAGAVIIGKANLSEWANFRSSSATSGWSSLGGQTKNAYVLDRNPCGSSSGSAVAVAARLVPLAVGTETDGSIVCPAAANGVVGIKPTAGIVSRAGIVPLAASQDTAGPLARSVAEAALLLGAIAEPGTSSPSADIDRFGTWLGGVRVGVVRNYFGAHDHADVEAAFRAALSRLRSAGATLVDPVEAMPLRATRSAEMTVLLAEFRDDIDSYLATVRDGPHSLNELIDFNASHEDRVMPHFGQELFTAARDSGGRSADAYRAAVATIRNERARLARLFATNALDVLVAPANAPAWRTDYAAGDAASVSSSSLAAISGYPSVVLPTSLIGELPVGIAFIGRPHEDAALLAVAAAYERLRGPFPEPLLLRSEAEDR